MEKVLFTEKQRMPVLVGAIMTVFILLVFIFGGIAVQADDPDFLPYYILLCVPGILPISLLFFAGIEVKITADSFYYRSLPFRKRYRQLPKSEIQILLKAAKKGQLIGSYNIQNSGRRQQFLLKRQNILVIHNKKTILIGTKKPREFQYMLDNHWNQNESETI